MYIIIQEVLQFTFQVTHIYSKFQKYLLLWLLSFLWSFFIHLYLPICTYALMSWLIIWHNNHEQQCHPHVHITWLSRNARGNRLNSPNIDHCNLHVCEANITFWLTRPHGRSSADHSIADSWPCSCSPLHTHWECRFERHHCILSVHWTLRRIASHTRWAVWRSQGLAEYKASRIASSGMLGGKSSGCIWSNRLDRERQTDWRPPRNESVYSRLLL